MNAQDLEQRALEFLAAEYERDGRPSDADFTRGGLPVCDADIRALRAIVAALRQQPAPVDLEQFREAVECLCNGAGSISSAEWARRDAERKRLLALIDNAGKVETAGVPTDGGLAQRGEAWLKVAQALNWYAPWWLNGEGTGREKAVAAIKKMAKVYGATQPAPVADDARMARALEWVRDVAQGMPASAAKEHLPAIQEAIAAYDPNCGGRTVRVVDDELPGMWSQSDFMGGAADAADDVRQLVPSVDDAMVDRYLAAQAKAVQEIDNKWGNGGKAPSYIHPVREACRAGLTAALAGGAK